MFSFFEKEPSATLEQQLQGVSTENKDLQYFYNFLNSPGFKYLKQHVENTKAAIIEGLLLEKNKDAILDLQARHAAFSSVLESIQVFATEFITNTEAMENLEAQIRMETDQYAM